MQDLKQQISKPMQNLAKHGKEDCDHQDLKLGSPDFSFHKLNGPASKQSATACSDVPFHLGQHQCSMPDPLKTFSPTEFNQSDYCLGANYCGASSIHPVSVAGNLSEIVTRTNRYQSKAKCAD